MISTVIIAIVSFISTNIDDIFIFMLFFSQLNSVMKRRHVVIGQYLGIGVLASISIVGAMGVAVIPHEYVGLLGLVPVYLGIKAYLDHKKEDRDNEHTTRQELQNDKKGDFKSETETGRNQIITWIKKFINPSVIKVFSVTIANGGDNIGIYIPLFTSLNLLGILITVGIFALLTAFWCFIALKLSRHSFVIRNVEKYKHILVPIIFISLGIFVLIENGTITFFCGKIS